MPPKYSGVNIPYLRKAAFQNEDIIINTAIELVLKQLRTISGEQVAWTSYSYTSSLNHGKLNKVGYFVRGNSYTK